jgi:AbrB family looped-hinge helix DNA binding protein
MKTITITKNSQLTLPKNVRDSLQIKPGQDLHVEALDENRAVISTKPLSAARLNYFKSLIN